MNTTIQQAKAIQSQIRGLSDIDKVYHDLFKKDQAEFEKLVKADKSKAGLQKLFVAHQQAADVIATETSRIKEKAQNEIYFQDKVNKLLADDLAQAIELSKTSKQVVSLVGQFDFDAMTYTLKGKSRAGKSSGGHGGVYLDPMQYQYNPVVVYRSRRKSSLVGTIHRSAQSLFVVENDCIGQSVPSWSAKQFLQDKNNIHIAYLDRDSLLENEIDKISALDALKHFNTKKNTKQGVTIEIVQEYLEA